jgi:hypothetical protein
MSAAIVTKANDGTETGTAGEQATVACAVELPAIKRDGFFYAGIACLVVAATIMPMSHCVVPLLGLSATQTAIVLGIIATVPDTLCVVAIGLLGTDLFRYLILRTKNAMRSFAEGRFRAGGPGAVVASVIERLLDRLLQLVDLYARPLRFCRNAVTFLFAAPTATSLTHN